MTAALPPDPALPALLAAWLPRQRWFAGDDGSGVTLRRREILFATDEVTAELVVVRDEGAPRGPSYLVLLAWRAAAVAEMAPAQLGVIGPWWCYDGLHDAAVTAALYEALAAGTGLGPITAHRHRPLPDSAPGRVLDAEQSNTSVVYGDAVIVKFFRQLLPGESPDAEIARALDGCGYTADLIGVLDIELAGSATTLALATAFAADAADGWSMATASVRDLLLEADLHADEVGGDFAGEAVRLGAAIAQVHRVLATAFPTATTPGAPLIDAMIARAHGTVETVPGLTPLRSAIESTFHRLRDELGTAPIPVQRIHGDLHLGQVLRRVDGWIVIDFEGEPSGPLAERRAVASPLRDIAGMVRSFHYAADHRAHFGGMDAQQRYRAAEWAARNREAFFDGYAAVGADPREQGALLAAFELDKAIYEVGYEHAHRPGWESTPLEAVAGLTAQT